MENKNSTDNQNPFHAIAKSNLNDARLLARAFEAVYERDGQLSIQLCAAMRVLGVSESALKREEFYRWRPRPGLEDLILLDIRTMAVEFLDERGRGR